MCELLVKAVDHNHADPEKDRSGCYKKGDVVVVMPDGHEWGRKEGLPKFVRVVCDDLDLEVARERAQEWELEYDFEVLQRDETLDGWRFKVVNLQRRSDGAATPEVEPIRTFFENWNAAFVRVDSDGVVLDWTVAAGALSVGFWGQSPVLLGLVVTETEYDESGGWHTFSINWSGATFDNAASKIRKGVERAGGEILTAGPFTGTYRIHRDSVRDAFVEAVKDGRSAYKRRRFSFSEADVDTAIDAGGVIALTAAQVAARVIDARAM